MKTLFRWLFRTVLFAALLITLLIVSVTLLKIPIDLTLFKGPIETLVSKALKRPVTIDQSIVISTSVKPVFTLKGLQIGNPDSFSQKTFITLDTARIQLELLPLLQKKVYVSEVNVQKMQVTLEEKKSGAVNWITATDNIPDEQNPAPKTLSETTTKTGPIDWALNAIASSVKSIDGAEKFITGTRESIDWAGETIGGFTDSVNDAVDSIDWTVGSIAVKKLILQDIALSYYGPDKSEPSLYHIAECTGSMLPDKPLELGITGNLQSFPYTSKITIASLKEFLLENRSEMDITAEIAKTKLLFSGNINLAEAHRSLALKANVSGKNLNSLNELLHLDLPPLSPYDIKADLLLKKNQLEIKEMMIHTGSSSLNGTAQVIKKEEKTEAVLGFTSLLIQVNDFIFDNWSWSGGEEPSTADKSVDNQEKSETALEKDTALNKEHRNLLDPDVLNNFDVTLNLRADKVLLGDEELGNGTLKATVHHGRITIEPLKLNVPGGSVELSVSLKPGKEKSDASFKAVISDFDIGILAKRKNPASKMGGLINLDMNLQSSATSFDQILASGNGYFDFSGKLKNMRSGIIDLWAVNLITAIVSSTDKKESNINCAVGRWQVNDGSLTPDLFFIDTSKIRICGTGQVDFSTNQVDMTISPTPKMPEFFNLATPFRVHGSFSDIQLGTKKGGIVGSVAKFITSPLHVPIRRALSKEIPKDGSDACAVVLGPDNRSELTVRGCQ